VLRECGTVPQADDPVTALKMEREENEHRKDLTPSEKVEIGRRIEEAQGNRQGQRTDLQPKTDLSKSDLNVKTDKIINHDTGTEKELVQNFVQVESGTKTCEIAAEAVDMNRETYRQAKKVIESGNQEIIQAMDNGVQVLDEIRSTARGRITLMLSCAALRGGDLFVLRH